MSEPEANWAAILEAIRAAAAAAWIEQTQLWNRSRDPTTTYIRGSLRLFGFGNFSNTFVSVWARLIPFPFRRHVLVMTLRSRLTRSWVFKK
jgi:hypothetical protein